MGDNDVANLLSEIIGEVRMLREAQTIDWRSLSRGEAACYLGLHKDTLYRLAKEGDVAYHQAVDGAPLTFTRDDLDTYRAKIRHQEIE